MKKLSFHLRVLRRIYELRKTKNPRYSLRAYSKYLGMDASALSRVLRGKQQLSPGNCTEILRKLRMSRPLQRIFIRSVLSDRYQRDFSALMKAARAYSNAANASTPSFEARESTALSELFSDTELMVLHEEDLINSEQLLALTEQQLGEADAKVKSFVESLRQFENSEEATHRLLVRLSSDPLL